MLRTNVPLCVVEMFVMLGVAGCKKKSGEAVVIGQDYVAVVKAGEENQGRAGD